MQKWEYLILYIWGKFWHQNDKSIGKYNSFGRPTIDEIPVSVYLNKLGDDGWELVTTGNDLHYVFKRPKA